LFFAQHLVKHFDDYPAVDDVSLLLRRAETVALLGPGGAGKTSVFQMLIGVLRPDSGEVTLDGVDITAYPIHERARLGLSYLPQEASVFRTMTVEQNLLLALETCESDRRRRRETVENLLTAFRIQDIRGVRTAKLSGGERRRCEIARTMATRPNYVLLDEPFAGLDPLAVNDMRVAIKLLTAYGIGVLITDHNVRETLSFIDRAYVIESGRILMEGTADAVIANPEVRRAYLGAGFSL
jgi:lipopolysaccharide export system ATP-binding protein